MDSRYRTEAWLTKKYLSGFEIALPELRFEAWNRTTKTMLNRIKLHLLCPCRNIQQARFHLLGIVREFMPERLQEYVR